MERRLRKGVYSGSRASKALVLLIVCSFIVYTAGIDAFAATGPVPDTTKISITKELAGEDMPSEDTEFEFSITDENGDPAKGMMDKGNGETAIPDDGIVTITSKETLVLSGLAAGKYTIRETKPGQSNYAGTSVDVDGTLYKDVREATVEVKDVSKPGGGWMKDDSGALTRDADGFFTYVITPDQIDENGDILIDFDPFAERIGAAMNQYVNLSRISSKVKIINETGEEITYKDYSFDTHNYIPGGSTVIAESASPTLTPAYGFGFGTAWNTQLDILSGNTDVSPVMDVTGFDGTPVRAVSAPLRATNPAVISYFRNNPHMGTLTNVTAGINAQNITLLQMNSFNELIKEAFTFNDCNGNTINVPADSSRTYADFICLFYGVGSLDELTDMQKYNVLGTGSNGSPACPFDGQSAINGYIGVQTPDTDLYFPTTALSDPQMKYFLNWGFASQLTGVDGYSYQSTYYIMENDPLITAMGYEFLYDRCMRFSFDNDTRNVYSGSDNSMSAPADVSGIKSYIDRTNEAVSHVETAFNKGEWLGDNDTIELPNIKGYIEVPNAFNQWRIYDFGFDVTFKAKSVPPEQINVKFTNEYSKKATPPEPNPPKPDPPTPNPPEPNPPTPNPPAPNPPSDVPNTGDESGSGLALWLLLLSGCGIALTLGYGGKRMRKNDQGTDQ